MAAERFDFAIMGSTPLARLLAGLLASVHRKRVVLVRDTNSPFRLTRGLDLSVAPITRPETWALLGRTVTETQKVLSRAGARSAVERVDPIFVAEQPASIEMLSHLRHVALGFGQSIDRVPGNRFGDGTVSLQVNDALMLSRPQLEPILDTWLLRFGVRPIAGLDSSVVVHRDGTATITTGADTIEADLAILADDAAILAHLGTNPVPSVLRAEPALSLMTEPTSPLAGTPIQFLDRAVTLVQRSSRGIAALSMGRMDEALTRIGACLVGQQHVRRAGQAVFRTLVSIDGAPVVGPVKSSKAFLVAGLGMTGAFLAPALARYIAGAASEDERRYFGRFEDFRGAGRAFSGDYRRWPVQAASSAEAGA